MTSLERSIVPMFCIDSVVFPKTGIPLVDILYNWFVGCIELTTFLQRCVITWCRIYFVAWSKVGVILVTWGSATLSECNCSFVMIDACLPGRIGVHTHCLRGELMA